MDYTRDASPASSRKHQKAMNLQKIGSSKRVKSQLGGLPVERDATSEDRFEYSAMQSSLDSSVFSSAQKSIFSKLDCGASSHQRS